MVLEDFLQSLFIAMILQNQVIKETVYNYIKKIKKNTNKSKSTIGRSGLPDCTASWYFWKLPTDQITPLTRGIMWLMYSSHQIFIWALIYKAQLEMSPEGRKKRNDKGPKYRYPLKSL